MPSKPNLGPGDFQTGPGKPFYMSRPEFIALQTYCEAATNLPTSRDEVHTKLGIAVEDEAAFDDMIGVYKTIHDHCTDFSVHTYPDAVTLAADIVDYGRNKVPVFYGALLKVVQMWQDGQIPDDKGLKKVEAILTNLKADAQSRADKAKAVADKVKAFATQTQADKTSLAPVQQRYHDTYEGSSGIIAGFDQQIGLDRQQIGVWNTEYNHDVVVASTSATYAFVFPFGTIAAAVVAGVYGKRATDALDTMRSYQKKLADAEEGKRKAVLLMGDLTLADTSMTGLITALDAALPVIQKMQGIWLALADDVAAVLTGIGQNIEQVPKDIMDLGVDTAIDQWSTVATEADAWRVNAFVSIVTVDDIQRDPQKFGLPQAA